LKPTFDTAEEAMIENHSMMSLTLNKNEPNEISMKAQY
jgi:hypothetical protein